MNRVTTINPICLAALAAVVLGLAPVIAADGNYPNGWRGDGTGYWPDAKIPLQWDGPTGKNIRWKVALPAKGGNGSPVFGPGRVLVLSDPDRVQCFATADGKLLWQDQFSCIDVAVPEVERADLRQKLQEGWQLLHANSAFCPDPASLRDPAFQATKEQLQRGNQLFGAVQARAGFPGTMGRWVECAHTQPTPVATRDRVVLRHASNVIGCYDWDGKRQWIARPSPSDAWRKGQNPKLLEFTSLVIVEPPGERPLVVTIFIPNHADMGISEEGYKQRKLPDGGGQTGIGTDVANTDGAGVEALVAYDLATGAVRWRSKAVRQGGPRCNPLVTMTVDKEPVIFTGGGSVVRARDGAVVLENIGWNGYGNAPGISGNIVVFNEGNHWWAPRYGHNVYAYRLIRQGNAFQAEKLWEWGYTTNVAGHYHARSPVIAAGKVFISGPVFDLATGASLLGSAGTDARGRFAYRGQTLTTDRSCYVDPIVAGKHVYLVQDDGSTIVASTAFEALKDDLWKATIVNRNRLFPEKEEGLSPFEAMKRVCISTPQVWQDSLYIRQHGWLWCIAETKK